MDKTFSKVLNLCIKLSKDGEAEISVFDLLYETGLPYTVLKGMLDNFVAENELAEIDIKTYKFIGDTNRELDEPEPIPESLDDRIAILERRRQELLAKMDDDEQEACGKLFVTDAQADGELMHCDDDEELDRKFAEYERYLNEELPEFTGDDENEEREQELVKFMVALFKDGHKKAVGKVPAHTEWDDEDDLLRFCAEQIITLISRDKSIGKQSVIKKAVDMLASLRGMENVMVTELYERIIYELKNMSNYYFNKIREQC
ncbi:MAG: hypothetical protein K2O28_01630 [Clostridia bacterium]|nr:hypothetical protein [Clostridia bacterium]